MNLISLAIRRPTAVAMCTLAVVCTRLAAFTRLPLDLTPDVSFPKLSVVTYWPDTSPETVEAFVTSPIEAAANTITNARKVDSISEEGKSTVNIEFSRGTDMDFAALELSEKLSVIRDDLPYGVQPPQIQKYVPEEFQTGRFLSYNLTGPYTLQEIRRFALEKLRGPLLAVEGVADVQVFGGQDPELQLELDPNKLRAFDLSEAQVAAALQDLNLRVASGKIFRGRQRFDLIVDEALTDPEQIEEVIVAANNGSAIRVRDLATVSLGYAEPRSYTRINGNPAVVVNIEKEAGSNTIKVADRIFVRLSDLQTAFPPKLQLIKQRDQSTRIRDELSNLSSRAVFCIAVIFLVLLAALRNWSSPVIILSTILFSVLLTINLFYFAGIGLNLITLAGLALGSGMLVDNSIVVLDNIQRCRERGLETVEATQQGAREMALPVLAATLTTVAAFIPFLYLTGELRIYYLPFALAVGLSLLSSLMGAFTFTPSLALKFMPRGTMKIEDRELKIEKDLNPSSSIFPQSSKTGFYPRLLAFALRHKLFVISLILLIFAGSYHLFDKYVTKGRIWSWGEDTYLVVSVNMPTGAEIKRTDAIAKHFETHLVGNKNIEKIFTNVSAENARIHITFPRKVQLTAAPLILKEQLTNLAVQIAGPHVGVFGFGPGFYSGGGSAPQFRVQVLGYNYNEVKRIADDVGRKLARNPRVRDVNTNTSRWGRREDLFETVLRVDRQKLQRFQLTAAQVLNALQSYLRESLSWQRIKFAGKEIDYRIKMRGHHEFDMEELGELLLETPQKETVRLSEVAHIGERKVLPRIVRENQQYQRWIAFEYRGPWKFGDRLVESVIENTKLPHGYKLQRGSFFFLQEEEKRQIYWVIAFALLLVYMVTAGLFESLLQPFIVILTVPLALIGVFWMFYLTDTNFDRSAYIGVVLLAGIVVNNSIILVHHINSLRHKGLALLDAIIQGAYDRLRPILMTTATTVFGLLPLVLFTKTEESIWYALSLATIGGLLSSTLLVLVVIPVGYVWLARVSVHSQKP
ncbi:efflux RND transporter permease subunit [candidate division KSB1 bacterium]|nr:efflux RND transporter permease subunit [candidate division KSB1 bacterium]NIR72622.1 efflux RND transporter permease subunit [candidate division KSB1 bacterium]NIS27333.1 efflux RND transporter permease subunit [candidate division KSB1 bacterium]NIT73546.1 efflux RND transporter permease subunit [candidate division KSB1 bacterium]NIU25394.1 efflux RND transporter permease subunit [candidate division KSB1 bacterium]